MFQFTDQAASTVDSMATGNQRHDDSDAIAVTEHIDETVPSTATATATSPPPLPSPTPISDAPEVTAVEGM